MIFKRRKMNKRVQEFFDYLVEVNREQAKIPLDKRNFWPYELSGQKAFGVLISSIMGDDYYIVDPLPNIQANPIILYDILMKIDPAFRRAVKNKQKRRK
mgnify:FL=1|jgi:hypothetical protein|nr:MAG TPA: hypothetical protein [Caudoviricetes sp.]